MTERRDPEKGEAQIVVLLESATFVGWAPYKTVDQLMDAFEKRSRLTVDDRDDQLAHAAVRVRIAQGLRSKQVETMFPEVLAAGCVWLALRHWSAGDRMRQGVQDTMDEHGFAVITCSIAVPPPEGMMPDSAWAFMVGDRVHDGRPRLAAVTPGEIELVLRD